MKSFSYDTVLRLVIIHLSKRKVKELIRNLEL